MPDDLLKNVTQKNFWDHYIKYSIAKKFVRSYS